MNPKTSGRLIFCLVALSLPIRAQDIHQAAKSGNLEALKSLWAKYKALLHSTL